MKFNSIQQSTRSIYAEKLVGNASKTIENVIWKLISVARNPKKSAFGTVSTKFRSGEKELLFPKSSFQKLLLCLFFFIRVNEPNNKKKAQDNGSVAVLCQFPIHEKYGFENNVYLRKKLNKASSIFRNCYLSSIIMESSINKKEKRRRNAACSCLMMVLVFIRKAYDSVCDWMFGLFYSNVEVKKIPPVTNPIVREKAVDLAEKIRTQELTSEKVVAAFIERAKQVNHIINSIVHDRFEKAIEDAKAVDELIRSGSIPLSDLRKKKPLLGVPYTSKESTACKGMSWTCGMLCRKETKASDDAEFIKRLQEAGAILIGVTNVPELNLWIETRNYVYGQTNNPYNTNRIAGGSSGGEATIVSCCGSPIGIGTDIGGSTRLPAYFCGVYGHKLTGGLINTRGMTFRSGNEKQTIVSAGPLTRYAADLEPSSVSLVQHEKLPLLRLDREVHVRKLNFFYVTQPGDKRISPISSELSNALLKTVRLIKEERGNADPPLEVRFPGFKYSYTLWRYWMSKEENNFAKDIKNGQEKANAFVELIKKLLGQSEHTFAAIIKLIDMHLPLPSDDWAVSETDTLKKQILEKLGDNGVLLFPSYPSTAPYHYLPFLRPYNFGYWGIFNVLQLPCTQIPLGLSNDGLPLGIQVVAAPNQDKLCFAVAEYLEKLVGGWVPPFPE